LNSSRRENRTSPREKARPAARSSYINNKLAGQGAIPVTIPLLISLGEGLNVGRDPGSPTSKLYQPPFEFTGRIYKVTVDVSGKMIQDTEEEMKAFAKAAMARQ
jgi:arylsulfatase